MCGVGKTNAWLFFALVFYLVFPLSEVQATEKKQAETLTVEELTVTAQKREENIQQVPISMEALSGDNLEDMGLYKVSEMTRLAPNFFLQRNSFENNLVIRGVSTTGNTLNSSAGIYIDDVALPFNYMFDWDLFDLERVELLRGPQGTTYGRNTESGLINIITKQPGDALRAKVYTELGLYDSADDMVPSYTFGGNVSGPLVDHTLYLGMAGRWEYSDGFMTNLSNGDDEVGRINRLNGRATLRWTPSRPWDLSLIGDFLNTDDGDGRYRYFTGPYVTERNKINYDRAANHIKQDGQGLNLRVRYQGTNFDMVSVTGRRYWHGEWAQDYDMGPAAYGDTDADFNNTLLSQELRFSSPTESESPWQWLAGLYAFREDAKIDYANPYSGMLSSDLEALGGALFGQVTYSIWERLHLSTGLRFEVMDQHGDQTLYVDGQDPASWDGDMDNQELLPRLAVAYDLTDKITTYASAARGYLSGNFRYWGGSAQGSFQYNPEYSWNYEAGIKTSLWRDRLILNGSLFYIDMRDKQVMEYSSELQGMELLNAAEAHSEGFELSLRAKPMEGLSFTAGFGYASAKIDDWLGAKYDSSSGGVVQIDYSGNYLSNAPRFTYNLGAEYRHRSGFMAGVDLLGTGEYYTDNENTMKTDGYQVVNLRVGYESESFDIVLWAKNLLDEQYLTMTYNWSGSYLGYEAPPRMIGLRLVWRY